MDFQPMGSIPKCRITLINQKQGPLQNMDEVRGCRLIPHGRYFLVLIQGKWLENHYKINFCRPKISRQPNIPWHWLRRIQKIASLEQRFLHQPSILGRHRMERGESIASREHQHRIQKHLQPWKAVARRYKSVTTTTIGQEGAGVQIQLLSCVVWCVIIYLHLIIVNLFVHLCVWIFDSCAIHWRFW